MSNSVNNYCTNCSSLGYISFQKIQIDDYSCLQKAKCQACKFEWVEFWYVIESRHFLYHQQRLSTTSKKNKQKLRPAHAETKMSEC